MFLRELKEPVQRLKGVGPAAAENLARLGIVTVGGLLGHYPRDWEDRSRTVQLKDWEKSRVCTEVTILGKDWFGFGKTRTLKIYVEDASSIHYRACLVCFNRPFLEKQFPPGTRAKLYGQFFLRFG